jgi:aryl-alcohol dehydrogenase-like predicted oxidoreductase
MSITTSANSLGSPSTFPHATPEGTRRFLGRLQSRSGATSPFIQFTRTFGKTGLQISPVGFGCYRVSDDVPEHHEALRLAILSGCNLIDTSTNYGDGASERLVGDVLAELFESKRLMRDEIVIVTKAGYVQGQNMALAKRRIAEGNPFPEMVEYDPSVWHCISPEFLKDQITRSLQRLQLECLDAILLHNPEYYLKAEGDHREYYRRIREAFEYLETEVRSGRIARYGISSNTFPYPREADSYTSLEAIWDLAQELEQNQGGTHHFEVIQFPLNLYEPGAALEENNSGKSVIRFAHQKGLGTLANRPLNAFTEKGLVRLADFPAHDDRDIAGDLKSSWARAMELESAYPKLAPTLPVPAKSLAWGHILKHNFDRLQDIDTWKGTFHYQIQPTLNTAFARLESEPSFKGWLRDYQEASTKLFETFQAYLENQASYQSDLISSKIDHACPALHSSETLSEKAVRLYLSVEGMDCVLVGMRKPEYVRNMMELKNPVSNAEALHVLKIMAEEG